VGDGKRKDLLEDLKTWLGRPSPLILAPCREFYNKGYGLVRREKGMKKSGGEIGVREQERDRRISENHKSLKKGRPHVVDGQENHLTVKKAHVMVSHSSWKRRDPKKKSRREKTPFSTCNLRPERKPRVGKPPGDG